jgi:hypothetical protein
MTDINLQALALTPTSPLAKTGFLFGAESQGAAGPSVYTTQAVATTLLGSTSLTGDTLTASAPVLNLAQTWNNGAVTFTGMKFNVVSDTSAAASFLMDLQVATASKFSVDKSGNINSTGTFITAASQAWISGAGSANARLNTSGLKLAANTLFGWTTTANESNDALDTILRRKAAANLQLGVADAATALAQTLSVQSVVAGASNTVGQDFTITGSQGTGSGVGGSIIFQTAAANSGGGATIQNTLATAMVIDSVKTVRLGTGYTVATLPAAGTAGRRTYVTDALAPTFLGGLTGGGAVVSPVFDNGTAWVSA